MDNVIVLDGFRFVDNVHTQVRSLVICSQFIKTIGEKQLPKNLLKQLLIKWSIELENTSEVYRGQNGRLTENRKPTTAFERYLKFIVELGFATSHKDIIMNTRIGSLLSLMVADRCDNEFYLSNKEKLFYLYFLFAKDADGIVLSMDLLNSLGESATQSELMKKFENFFKERLRLKQEFATSKAQVGIGDKYRSIEYKWSNPQKYAEHIIVPRLEWLADLGIVLIRKVRGKTIYTLTPEGKRLHHFLIKLPQFPHNDINEDWLSGSAMKSFCNLIFKNIEIIHWTSLSVIGRRHKLQDLLEKAYKIFSTGGAMRMALYPSTLYVVINLACDTNVLVELEELELELAKSIQINNKIFSLRQAARPTEAYIAINFK